eukprot:3674688-Prymnesium_polylepis.1
MQTGRRVVAAGASRRTIRRRTWQRWRAAAERRTTSRLPAQEMAGVRPWSRRSRRATTRSSV